MPAACTRIAKTRILVGLLLAGVLLWLAFPVAGPFLGELLFVSTTSKDETINLCGQKVNILVPAKWTTPNFFRPNDNCCFSTRKRDWKGNIIARIRAQSWHNSLDSTNVLPSNPKLMYEKYFAKPDEIPQQYYADISSNALKSKREILNFRAEYKQINQVQVFVVSYARRPLPDNPYQGTQRFYKLAYYYSPKFAFYVSTDCPEFLHTEYEPVFDQVINSVQFNKALLAPADN